MEGGKGGPFSYVNCLENNLFKMIFLSQCVKKAVMLDSGNHSYWNALGVVAMSKGMVVSHIFF